MSIQENASMPPGNTSVLSRRAFLEALAVAAISLLLISPKEAARSPRHPCLQVRKPTILPVPRLPMSTRSFWLKDEENPDPTKTGQYARCHELRKVQEQNEKKSVAPAN